MTNDYAKQDKLRTRTEYPKKWLITGIARYWNLLEKVEIGEEKMANPPNFKRRMLRWSYWENPRRNHMELKEKIALSHPPFGLEQNKTRIFCSIPTY